MLSRSLAKHSIARGYLAALLFGLRIDLTQGFPEAQGAVSCCQLWAGRKPTRNQAIQQLKPAGFRLTIAFFNSNQLLAAMLCHAHHHQQAQAVIEADVAVNTVNPKVRVALVTQIALSPLSVLINPAFLEPGNGVS